ncbi:MAG: transglycosylase SLT domain-containing protein, partial [Desulfobacterales bacterium]
MDLNYKRYLPIIILTAVLTGTVSLSDARAESDTFPVPSVIEPNVAFWTKIYTEYSTSHGVLHDSRRLNIIYGVIELVDPDRYGGRKTNKKRIKKAKKKYKAILAKLMRGETPVGPVEQKVADQFGPDTKSGEFRAAMRRIRCQTGQKDRFRQGIIRSGAYLDEIRRIFRNKGLPEDLAYLPHVESSFNPKAYSKFGAAGMWQFTRSTGKYYMKVGYTIDERRDPIISSYAAAKLLRHNYRKLQNWPMAITAYNHGISGMLRAQRKKGSYERIFKEYRSRIFKFASRNFYSEFLAAREAAQNYLQYFGDLKLDSPVKSREVVMKGYVSLPQVARHLGFEMAELRDLNPALRRPVFRGQKYVPKGYRLRLPYRNDEDWEALAAKLEDKFYKHNQKKSRIYTVQRGDTTGKIARVHGVELADLIAANNLDSRATIYVNQNLRIPLPDEKTVMVAKRQPKTPISVLTTETSPSLKTGTVATNREKPETRQTLASLSTVQDSGGKDLNALMIEAGHPLVPVAERAPDYSQKKASKESLEDFPNDKLFVDNPMVEYLPPPKERVQRSVELTELVSDDAEGIREVRTSFSAAEDKSKPEPLRKLETRPGTFSIDMQQQNPQVILANLVVKRSWNQNGKSVGIIQVEVEETLGHYAEWLNVPAWKIRRLNGFRYGRALHLNQRIKIPLHRVTQEDFLEKRFEYHQELAEDFFASYRVEKVLTYSIKRGDIFGRCPARNL